MTNPNKMKMKKLIILSAGIFALVACNSPKSQPSNSDENQPKVEEQAIGGDKDDHGCLASAGETWSELKQSCIRVFSDGLRLNPTEIKKDEAVISAFVVFNDDKSKLELFLPDNSKEHIILEKSKGDIYQDATYKYDANTSTLYIDGNKKYEAEK